MRTNWASFLMDLALLGCAVYTREWSLLLLCLFTGGYRIAEVTK